MGCMCTMVGWKALLQRNIVSTLVFIPPRSNSKIVKFAQDVEMTAPPGDAAAGTGNGAEKKKFFPKKFGGVGMYFHIKGVLHLRYITSLCGREHFSHFHCSISSFILLPCL